MERGSAVAEERRRKEPEAARRAENMEVAKEAGGEGKVWRGGAGAEEEVAVWGGGDVYKWEEGGPIGRNWGMQGHQRQPVEAGRRPFWRPRGRGGCGRGGRGGGFQFPRRPWYCSV